MTNEQAEEMIALLTIITQHSIEQTALLHEALSAMYHRLEHGGMQSQIVMERMEMHEDRAAALMRALVNAEASAEAGAGKDGR